jgi:hypothetical protein
MRLVAHPMRLPRGLHRRHVLESEVQHDDRHDARIEAGTKRETARKYPTTRSFRHQRQSLIDTLPSTTTCA